MDLPVELLAVDHSRALNFFYTNLEDIINPGIWKRVWQQEIVYTSSILASFAQVSSQYVPQDPDKEEIFPTVNSWLELLAQYGTSSEAQQFPALMEHAAANSLLLLGFCRPYIAKHYNLADCCRNGSLFFEKSAVGKRETLMRKMACNFVLWSSLLNRLSHHLNEQRLLIAVPPPKAS